MLSLSAYPEFTKHIRPTIREKAVTNSRIEGLMECFDLININLLILKLPLSNGKRLRAYFAGQR